jgi:GntR family transcriptional regulator
MNTHNSFKVREAILRAIASGRWRSGAPIPSENELASEFKVSVELVRETLRQLEEERVLVSADQRRRRHRATDEVERSGHAVVKHQVTLSDLSEHVATQRERLHLGLSPKSKVYRIERVVSLRGRPFIFEQATVPADLCPGLLQKPREAEHIALLAKHYGLMLGVARERVSIGAANRLCATRLQIAAGKTIRILDRVVFDASGRALEWRRAYCVPRETTGDRDW